MSTYTPNHPSGHRGPSFEFASMACLWIAQQLAPSEWTWEQAAPSPDLRAVQLKRQAVKESHNPFASFMPVSERQQTRLMPHPAFWQSRP